MLIFSVREDAKVKVAKLGRLAVQNQMKIDEENRRLVEERKANELKVEQDMIESWQRGMECAAYEKPDCMVQCSAPYQEAKSAKTNHGDEKCALGMITGVEDASKNLALGVDANKSNTTDKVWYIESETVQTNLPSTTLPAPRNHVSICVKFTPKCLSANLPARESREKIKLKEKNVNMADTIDISEREPLFLQDKGDGFYEKNDFQSAINAYTNALQKDSTLLLCLANRAACFLRLKQFDSCIDDCTRAVLLLQEKSLGPLTSHVSDVGLIKPSILSSLKLLRDNMGSEVKSMTSWYSSVQRHVLMRRATAFCILKEFDKAQLDFDQVFATKLTSKAFEDICVTMEKLLCGHDTSC